MAARIAKRSSGDVESVILSRLAATTAGQSSLAYDSGADQYTYTWKTENAWAGACKQLIIRLTDGTDHIAYFRFR